MYGTSVQYRLKALTRQSKIAHKGPWAGLVSLALLKALVCNMVDPLIIKHADIKVANADYESLFLKHGNILFELNTEENRELVHAVSQFEKYTDKEPDIDQREWIKENINPLPSLKPLAVFIFLITQWRATTIVGNAESPNDGYIYVSITTEGSGH